MHTGKSAYRVVMLTDLVGLWPLTCQHFGADVAGVSDLSMTYDRSLAHAPSFLCSSQFVDVSGALDLTSPDANPQEGKYLEVRKLH